MGATRARPPESVSARTARTKIASITSATRTRGCARSFSPPAQEWSLLGTDSVTLAKTRVVVNGCGADGRYLAERWEELDDTTYVFHLRQGVKWHNKPPLNGRELVAEDVKFSYDRFLAEPGNANRYMLDRVERVEVVDRYTVKFVLKEPYVWLISVLAYPTSMWIIAPEVVEKYGDLKRVETAIGTGPFLLERYEPNVKTVFKRNPEYYRDGQPYVDGVEWLVITDESTGLAMYRTGQIDCGPGINWAVRQQDVEAFKKSHPHLMYQDFLSQSGGGDHHAHRYAALHRCAGAACDLPRHRSPGPRRGRLVQGCADRSGLPRLGGMVAAR